MMEAAIDANVIMDYAAFQIWPMQNRYEAFACYESRTEKISSGLLEHLALHLSEAKCLDTGGSSDSFKLKLPENLRGASWFTKSTLSRFLHIVCMPELLKVANAIENEMVQLEEARGFHLALYSQVQQDHSGSGAIDSSYLKQMEPATRAEVQVACSDPSKNELLRAMNLRLMASKEEFANALDRALGLQCSTKQISDLAAFAQHFGVTALRNSLFKYLEVREKNEADHTVNEHLNISSDSRNNSCKIKEGIAQVVLLADTPKPLRNGVSPAKVAQAERESCTDSEESCNSSDKDQSLVERSRTLVRSASPRRSASPMRRIQIGKSGSRRSTALNIKSLNYFPGRTSFHRDASGNSSGDEESDLSAKKPQNTVRRMSVQDAISLFENKQRDKKSDHQTLRSSADLSSGTNKSVLRRWSASMGDSGSQCPPDTSSEGGFHGNPDPVALDSVQKNIEEKKSESDFVAGTPDPVETAEAIATVAVGEGKGSLSESLVDSAVAIAEENQGRAVASAEWNQQKEAELNQMLMKIMENKPAKYRNTKTGNSANQEVSDEPKGGFYDYYKEKRDEKLRGENAGKLAQKEAQIKAMQGILDRKKAEMASKSKASARKQDSLAHSQKLLRNSSPGVLPKKDTPKAGLRKASSKASPLPAVRSSWPSTPSPKSVGSLVTKVSGGVSSVGTTANHRKPQATPSPPTRPSPKMERSQPVKKAVNGPMNNKRSVKGPEKKQQPVAARGSKSTKMKTPMASGNDSGAAPTKPSFYNKVTRKSSVVPLESKPFLRKGTGIGSGVVKRKASQPDETSNNSGNITQDVDKDAVAIASETTVQLPEEILTQPANNDIDLEVPINNKENCEDNENSDPFPGEAVDNLSKTAELPGEIQADEDSGISSAAWVEIDHQEVPPSCDNGPSDITLPAAVAPVTLSSPRVRHSLSQMLQADSYEPEIVEWGNAENPPTMIYQKDSPKGLKRLLKFARKSRGEANVTGWAGPSGFSEGEEDAEEPKADNKMNPDALQRKAALQAKGFGQQTTMFGESYDGGNSSKRSMEYSAAHELLLAQSNGSNFSSYGSHKLGVGQASAAATSTKASRSFFSLSTFRKSGETKLR